MDQGGTAGWEVGGGTWASLPPSGARRLPRRSLAVAGYGSRVAAFGVDLVGTGFGAWILLFLGAVIGGMAIGLVLAIGYSLWYHVWRVARTGSTWGMAIIGLRVADKATGLHPVGVGRAFVRVAAAAGLGLVCIGAVIDLLWPLWDADNQTLHDKAASTVVLMRR